MELSQLTDRELLEGIYLMLIQVYNKINNDGEALAINLFADLLGTQLTKITGYEQVEFPRKNETIQVGQGE